MNSVEGPVVAGYQHSQPQVENSIGHTKHWTQSRTIQVLAGAAVVTLGVLAGLTVAFFASTFAASIVAGAVTVVLGVSLIGYVCHPGQGSTATLADALLASFTNALEDRAAKMLQPYQLDLYKSCRDGNCYFDSVIHQCPAGSNWTIQNLRFRVYQEAKQWCEGYRRHFDPAIHSSENDLYSRLIFYKGLEDLQTDNAWVDATDSAFTAKILNTPIVVMNIDGSVAHAFDAEGQFMNDAINFSMDFGYFRNILNNRFILLIFDSNHFMGVSPITKQLV